MTLVPEEKTKIYTSSVRRTLLASFGAVVLGSMALVTVVLIIHGMVTSQYAKVTNRLILENGFATLVPEYLDSYFEVLSAGQGATGKLQTYQSLRNEINGDITQLDLDITDQSSLVAYRGFKNFVLSIVSECDAGVALVQQGNVSGAWDNYDKNIAPMRPFVYENASTLLTNELKVAEVLEKSVALADQTAVLVYLVMFLTITILILLISLKTADRIIKPMGQLSQKAREISEGNLEAEVEVELLARHDEIGSLASSFEEVLQRLRAELELQKKANRELANASQGLATKNEELERTNRLMVNREMKMIELKNQISELEKKQQGS
jgi:methyl-accepting chemotaxis protein